MKIAFVTLGQMEHVRFIFFCLAIVFVPFTNVLAGRHHGSIDRGRDNFLLFKENGKVGLKDEQGHILIPATYDAIGWSNGKLSIIDHVVGYQSEGMWGLINTSNKVLTPPEFLGLNPAEGSFLVAQKKSSLSQRPSFGVVNTSGKVVIPFIYDGLKLSNMRAVVMSRSGSIFRFGLTDLSHKVLIPIDYHKIYSLGSLRYAVSNFEQKTAIFSDDGNQVTGFYIDSIAAFNNGFAIVYQNGKQGLIDRAGEMVVVPAFAAVRLLDNGIIQAREESSWVFLEGDNSLKGEFLADGLQPISPQRYVIGKSGGYQLTDNQFKALHEGLFASLGDFRGGRAVFREGGKSGVVSTSGKVLIPASYYTLEMDDEFLRACVEVTPKPRWLLLDYDGKQVSGKLYEYIGPHNGRFYPVMNRGFWGAIDETGKEIVTCVHDSLIQSFDNHVVVKFKKQYGVMDLRNNWIVTPKENRIKIVTEDRYLEFDGATTFLKDFRGGIIYFSDNELRFEGSHVREHLPSGSHWLISMDGIIIERSAELKETDLILPESEGLRAIKKDGKYGFVDGEGRLRIANRYEGVKAFSNGMAGIRIRNHWGFIDRNERLVVQPVYDSVGNFFNGVAIVKQNNLLGLIDLTGKIILPLRYDRIKMNEHNRFVLYQENFVGMADESGRTIVNPKYDRISDPGNGYIIVGRAEKYGALTLKGVSTIPMIYDDLVFDTHHNQFVGLKKATWKTIQNTSAIEH